MRRIYPPVIVAVLILAAIPAFAGAGPRANRGARGAAPLLQSLPVPVRRTVQLETTGGTLDDISRTNSDDGDVIYDVDFTRLGKSRNLTVALNGKLLDIQVSLEETSFPVRATLRTLSQGAELGDITRNIGNFDEFTYDVEITRDGLTRDLTVDDNGVVLETQVFLNETPPSVQKTINAKVAGNTLGDIKKTIDEDETDYDVEMTKDGRNRSFTVSTNGDLEEEQVFAGEIPQPVQKAIQAQAGRGHLGKINKSTDEGKDFYEVAVHIGLNTSWVTFDSAGALASEEDDVDWSLLPAKVKIAVHPLQVAGEGVTDITRTIEGTNTTYDIELRNGKTRRTVTFDQDGTIRPP